MTLKATMGMATIAIRVSTGKDSIGMASTSLVLTEMETRSLTLPASSEIVFMHQPRAQPDFWTSTMRTLKRLQ